MVFITASPLLARTVGKLYHRVLNYLKGMLRDKETGKKVEQRVAIVSEEKAAVIAEEKVQPDPEDDFEVIGEDESSPGGEESKTRQEEGQRIVNDTLKDFDMKILEEAEKEIEEMMDDIKLDDDNSEVPNSFYKVSSDHFPLFLTLREFLYLMDSLMGSSFFLRNVESIIRAGIKKTTGKKGYYRQKENSSSNRIYDNILYREVEREAQEVEISSDDDMPSRVYRANNDYQDLNEPDRLLLSDTANIKNEDLVTEVDYEDFKDIFFPEFLNKLKAKKVNYKNIPIQTIWQKIRNMDLQYMTHYEITDKNGQLYFDCYQAYKQWKEKTGNYDLNDLYMHLNVFYENDVVANNLIDFLFIDEIQDIPIHLLNYLKRFGTKFFYFSGDNAQNISKGVTFKFKDLANSYNQYASRRLNTSFFALTTNYRSHQQILELGNNIVLLIKMLFPSMIEYLPPEQSPMTGPRPVLVPLATKEDALLSFMKESMGLKKEAMVDPITKKESLEYRFANSQVFITRDYRAKQALLAKYPNCIALTILEAKGMEFDDVILYNYFSDSESHKPVVYFSEGIKVIQKKVAAAKEPELSKDRSVYYRQSKADEVVQYTIEVDMSKSKLDLQSACSQKELEQAADELKLLYVAITRARRRVLIFDEVGEFETSKHSRSFFDKFWIEQGLVDLSTSTEVQATFRESSAFEKVKDRKKWIKDGLEYLEKGIYEFAELCFRSGEFDKGATLASLCKMAHQYKKDYLLLESVESASKEEQQEIETQREATKKKLKEIGDTFFSYGWKKQAIQSYTIAGYLKECAEIYKSMGDYEKAADYYSELGRFDDAFECYKIAKDYTGMMDCLQITKEPKQILDLYKYTKEKLPEKDKPRILNLAKRKLREILLNYNQSLLNDEIPVYKSLDGADLSDENQFETPETLKDTSETPAKIQQGKPAEEPQALEKPEDDDLLSFEAIDIDEKISDKGSFEYVKSEIDELEKLSESFVGVSVQDQKIITSPSLFEDVGSSETRTFTFNEIQILTKAVSMLLQFYDDFVKQPRSEEADTIYELDMIEIPESTCIDIIKFLDETGANSLRILFEHKVGLKKHLLDLFISYLFETSPLATSSIYESSQSVVSNIVKGNYNEIRRLATMSFLTVLQRFDHKAIKDCFEKDSMNSKVNLTLAMMLGYFRQLIHLLNPSDACKVLATFAEIQMLIMLKVNQNQVDLFDKEAVFTDLFVAPGVKKLAILYLHFDEHPDVLHSGLLYFSAHYLWERRTYAVANFNDHVSNIKNTFLRKGLTIIKSLLDRDYSEAFKMVLNLNNSKISMANTLEAGYLAGILIMSFYFNPKFYDKSMGEAEYFKSTHDYVKPLMNYFKEDILLKSSRKKFLEGMLLALGISMVDVECAPLTHLACFGALAHRNSFFLKLITDSTAFPMDFHMLGMPPLMVADCGQEFYAVPYKDVLQVLNTVANLHLEQLSKIL